MRPAAPRRLLALLAVLVLAAPACAGGSDDDEASAAPGGGEVAAAPVGATDEPAPAPTPDALPDPLVPPGRCEVRTYTPPTAPDPHDGLLCRPTERQRDVAVVLVHGGGGVEGAYSSLTGWARRLNAEGYVTFQISYHLFSPGSGESPVFPRPEQNVKAAVQFLRGTGNALGIAKDRIAVQGHSAGARLGAVAFTSPGSAYFAGDELWPDIDDRVDAFVGFYHPYDGTMMHSAQYYGGSLDDDDPVVQRRWAEADSLAGAADADAPALLVNGAKDWDVIDEQQDELVARLRADGQQAEAVIIEGGAHGFDLGGARLTRLGEQAAAQVLEFLNDVFPQDPPRPAQSEAVDLSRAPTGTGTPPTTVPYRPRRPSSTTGGGGSRAGGGVRSGVSSTATTAGAADGDESGGSTSTVVPETTAAPSTSSPPTTAPPTTVVVTEPPTTSPPTTGPPTTAPPTTAAPPGPGGAG